MNRLPMAFCLSTSLVALGLAAWALLESKSAPVPTPATPAEEIDDTRALVNGLRKRVDELEARQDGSGREAVRRDAPVQRSAAAASAPADALGEQIEALTRRVEKLEDGETIAELAESGAAQRTEKALRSALAILGSAEVSAEARLDALKTIRKLRNNQAHYWRVKNAMHESGLTERDLVMPMLELARDTGLDAGFRIEVVRHLVGSKVEELRPPLLDLLAFDEIPEVREGAMDALMYHLEDSEVQQAITRASQEDRDEAVRARAEKYLPKVQHFAESAAEDSGALSRDRAK